MPILKALEPTLIVVRIGPSLFRCENSGPHTSSKILIRN
jgi:hypothetical protein